ncbi:MAG TPA: VIT1/CCC1 transporter family protein [Bacteroidota bacterium]|nr:VIT1/CCC1 transporter family protein [Bacteroidota bacterium]
MPQIDHTEKHFRATDTIRDIVIGMSDGLTVPFALAAGLTGAAASTGIVVTAGFAEIVAGSIAMGLGGYLAAKTDSEHYASERLREYQETIDLPDKETEEVAEVFRDYGLTEEHISPVVAQIKSDRDKWIDFMMRFELGLEKPDPSRASRSARTIAFSYILGGLIPLFPYMIASNIITGLYYSIAVTGIALFCFGYFKAHFTGFSPWRGAFQTVLVGGLASGAAFALAKIIRAG